jgi:Spy/CpxP family protein refolding chaperone
MKKRNVILISIVALVTLIGATFVYAGPHGDRGRHGGGPGFGMMGALGHLAHAKEELGLSDAQADQIKAIFKDLHEQNAALRDQIHDGMGDITDTLIANPNDIAGAQAILDRQAQAEQAMKASFLQAASKALNVLTPEQRTKLSAMVAEHRERRERR